MGEGGVLKDADIHAELAELEANAQNPERLVHLLGHIIKKIFVQGFTLEEKKEIADAAVKLLDHENADVVFEAGFVLKEVKEPSSYPKILGKLKEKPSRLTVESRRVLVAAAENIAIEVTGGLLRITNRHRGGEWKLRAFERMNEHSAMLRGLERRPVKLEKQKK